MSLILEALRKSEAERRRDSAPDVALELPPSPTHPNRSTPTWLWPVLVGTVVLLALGVWLGARMAARGHAAVATAPAAAISPQIPGTPVVPAPAMVHSPAASMRTPAAPALTTAPPPAASIARPNAPILPLPPPPPVATAPPPAPPIHTARPAASNDAPNIGDTNLPAIKLSMHLWDADPARRFVILDGQRMGEGDRSGTLSVIAIERNGVVIERNGQRARIPLP